MDLSDFQAAIASLKAATEISKGILQIKTTREIHDKVINLQAALLNAQSSAISATTAQYELQEKVRRLEEQLNAANEWGDQQSRYTLVSPWQGPAQVYALNRSASDGEAPHFLCSNCFHNRRSVPPPIYWTDKTHQTQAAGGKARRCLA